MRVEVREHPAQRRVREFLVIDFCFVHIILPDQLHRPREHRHARISGVGFFLPVVLGDGAIRDDSKQRIEDEENSASADE